MLKANFRNSEVLQLIMTLPSPSQNVLHSNENRILLISIVLPAFPILVTCPSGPINLSPRTTSTTLFNYVFLPVLHLCHEWLSQEVQYHPTTLPLHVQLQMPS